MSNAVNGANIIVPDFASKANHSNKKRKTKRILKLIFRIFKIIVYLFFFGIGLYGCFQTMIDTYVMSSTTVGNGLEIGFNVNDPNHTDIRFNLVYSGTGSFYGFSNFTWDYGPFYAIFVWPFAQLLLLFMWATRDWPAGLNAILGIFIILLIIRIITMAVSSRSIIQTERMSEIQGKINEINAKYKDAKDLASRQKKQMETQALYAKYNIKPFAAFEQMIITLPIFLIIYRVITTLRPLKFISIFGIWDMTVSPITEIFSNFTNMGWTYLFFLALVIPAQFLSQWLPRKLARMRSKNATAIGQQAKKSGKSGRIMNTVMNVFMTILVVVSATGIGVYWFFNSLFSMAQSAIIHAIIMKKRKNGIDYKESILTKLNVA